MGENPFAKEYHGQTTLHPLALGAVLLLGFATLLLPRRYAILPALVLACFIPAAQRIVVLTLDFDLLRILVLFGWARMVALREWSGFRWTRVDGLVVVYVLVGTLAYVLLHGTAAAAIHRLGTAFDVLGLYFLTRCLVRGWEDLDRIALGLAIISVPVAIAFLIEKGTGRNAFAVFGGVPEETLERQGRRRCQGAFPHPIVAGCFWAALLPIMAARYFRDGRAATTAFLGVGCGLVTIAMSHSSTPFMAVLAAIAGAAMYPLRIYLRLVRWGFLVMAVFLHIVMKAPVWHLIARIDLSGGATGWHRYHLIDKAIQHFGEWYLLGTPSTAHWGFLLYDVTNQYVLEGVRGGVLTLVLFVVILALSFQGVGVLLARSAGNRARTAMSWALGTALFVHATSFIAVSYFGSIVIVWYLLLGSIQSLVAEEEEKRERDVRARSA